MTSRTEASTRDTSQCALVLLIIDDANRLLPALSKLIKTLAPAASVVETANGLDALDLCAPGRPDVVLVGVKPASGIGVHLTRQIKTRWPQVRVFIITSYDSRALQELCLNAGAERVVSKDRAFAELPPLVLKAVKRAAP